MDRGAGACLHFAAEHGQVASVLIFDDNCEKSWKLFSHIEAVLRKLSMAIACYTSAAGPTKS